MKRRVLVSLVAFVASVVAKVGYSEPSIIGDFIAPMGPACQATETRTRCGDTGTANCADSTRSGYKVSRTTCGGTQLADEYLYDGPQGATGPACQATETRTRCGDSGTANCADSTRSGYKVSRKDCAGNQLADEYLYDGPQGVPGCTYTYAMKYINRASGTITYNNDTRDETTIGTRLTISGCDETPVNVDTYDGDDGTSFNFKGKVDSCDDLPTTPTPAQNDAYLVAGDGEGRVCIYTGTGWPSCPGGCAEFTGPQGDAGVGVCDNVADASKAVKNTARTYIGKSGNTRGYMRLRHSMCDGTTTEDDKIEDECLPVMPADSSTCTNGTYLECTPQDGGSTYYICSPTTNSSIGSAITGADPCASATTTALKKKTVKSSVTEYQAASGSQSSTSRTVGYATTVKKMCSGSNNDDVTITQYDSCVRSTAPDGGPTCATGYVWKTCTHGSSTYQGCFPEENIGKDEVTSNYVGPSITSATEYTRGYLEMAVGSKSTKVYDTCTSVAKSGTSSTSGLKCKCGGTTSSGKCASSNTSRLYCLGFNTTGSCPTSGLVGIGGVLDAAAAAETAANNSNPCASLSSSATEAQKTAMTKSMTRTYSGSGNTRTSISYATVTRNTCSTNTPQQISYEYDTCKEVAPVSTCEGDTKAYLECTDQVTKSAYNVCQTVTANTSLSGKITAAQTTATNAATAAATAQETASGKIDATYLTSNNYLTSSSNLNASNLTGTIDSGRLPSTVVTNDSNATHGLEALLATSLTSGNLKDVATKGELSGYVKTDGSNLPSGVITTGNLGDQLQTGGVLASVVTNDTLKEQILDTSVLGECTTDTTADKVTTTCTSGSIMAQIYSQLKDAIDAAGNSGRI